MADNLTLYAQAGDFGYWRYPYGFSGELTPWLTIGVSEYGSEYNGFAVFRNVTIPKGADITSCVLKLYASYGSTPETCKVRITFNAADSADVPDSAEDAYYSFGISRTTAHADWTVPIWSEGTQYSSPDLTAALQEIIDREGWEPGNDVAVLINDNESELNAYRRVSTDEYEEPELHIEYEVFNKLKASLSISSDMDGLIDSIDADLTIDSSFAAYEDSDVESYITVNSQITAQQYTTNNWQEDLEVYDSMIARGRMGIVIDDALAMGDETAVIWPESIDEALDLVESILAYRRINRHIMDGIFVYDGTEYGWRLSAQSSLEIKDALSEILGLIISEWLTLIDAQHNNWDGREIVIQPLNLYDIISYGKVITDTIDEPINITDSTLIRLTVAVLDYMGFSSLSSAMKSTAVALDEPLTLEDSAWRSFPAFAESILTCVDTATLLAAFIGTASSELSLGDSSSLTKMTRALASSPMVFTDSIANTGAFYNVLYDTLAMNVLIELDDEIYECYVLSTPKFLPSMYSGFDFNSYCVFENRAYGANRTGIYELTGETDAGTAIHTGVVLHDTDFGTHNFKRFRKGYMGISGQSPVMILETEDGTRRVYTISDTGRTTASHEQKSKKWKISIAEFDNLDTIQLVPIILTR